MRLFCASLASFILLPVSLAAQHTSDTAAASPAATPIAQQQTQNLTIDVAVEDRSGKPVRGLQQRDFTLLDDNQAKDIRSFRAVDLDAGTPAPAVEMLLVIDAINADPLKAERQRKGVEEFLRSDGGKLPLPVSLVTITDNQTIPIAASRDGNALAASLDQSQTGLRQINRSTLFSDTERFNLSLRALDTMIAGEAAKPGRKLIVWVSPGWPLLSRAATDTTNRDQRQLMNAIVKTSTALRLGHITLYHVVARGVAGTSVAEFSYYDQFLKGVKSQSQAYPENLALSVLAVQSGGLVLNGSNDMVGALGSEIARSASDAQVFYVLTFEGARAERADEYHALQVKVDQPGVSCRTRTGYYAQP